MPRYFLPTVLVTSVAVDTQFAEACSICSYALLDKAMPPVNLWSLFAIVWYLATSALVTWKGVTVWLVPRLGKAFIISIAAFIISAGVAGPIVTLALMLPAGVSGFRGTRNRDPRIVGIVGIVGVAIAVILGFNSYYIATTRTDVEYILTWQGTGPAASVFYKLRERGPEAAEDFREIVRRGSETFAGDAAQLLAEVGRPEKDVPILIESLRGFQAKQPDTSVVTEIEDALRTISGLDLPVGATAEEWKQAWHRARQDR